ncbi:MAG: DUF5329 domain-containing protein [Halioglobus sp.]
MNKLLTALFVVMLSTAGWADEKNDPEVEYLLSYVASSGCTFHRNGSDHDAAGAADHLRLKYRRGGKYVNNAEQFIDRLATESSWTGRKYTVTCGGEQQGSGEWLHRALDDYRKSHS